MIRAAVVAALAVAAVAGPAHAWAAQLDTTIRPDAESSPFGIKYQSVVEIRYDDGGGLSDGLLGKSWALSGSADSSDPAVQEIMARLNGKIRADGSQARISDMVVSYSFKLTPRPSSSSIDYSVAFNGSLSDYVIATTSGTSLVDLGWRALSLEGPVVVDGVDINIPLNLIRSQEPGAFAHLEGTDAEGILGEPIIDADAILELPLGRWHFLFDPTGVNLDADRFGLADEIRGIRSQWTMGESSIGAGIHVPKVSSVDVASDRAYGVKITAPPPSATIMLAGFASPDTLDGIEIAGVSDSIPEGYQINPTGGFPAQIIYGMAGLAAVAGIGFFIFSNRSLKNEKQGQQGIDPAHLVGYQTSSSAGGYQTNRGEAQLRDDSGYRQTRNVYEQQAPPPAAQDEAACGCAASAEMGSECDCQMQGSCLCDATCGCPAELCREHSASMG